MNRSKELFVEASELHAADRAEFLTARCDDDATLRGEVERLLAAFDNAADFLETPAVDRRNSLIRRSSDHVGERLGPYELTAPLGEGGMGVVWQAEQTAPVHRTVALKLLKPGIDSLQVHARFDDERRALERMDHPNIAKVLDAGVTEDGRPYFVMELVRGPNLTAFCDAHRLSISDRVRLFVPVCRAVQHAHSQGIIHRDLKPSNILVATDDDGAPSPKVIDFGIARAVDRSPDETIQTHGLVLLGTPAYVSPEQALRGQEVDARTDVYSLGAVLYELACGTPPFHPSELLRLRADELLRKISEDEPTRASRRTVSDRQLKALAEARGTTSTALRWQLTGDFDRIVMMALSKEPGRRYDTASAFADDLERLLRHQPVVAAHPSATYHAMKFARRHRAGLAMTSLIVLCLVVGTLASWVFAKRAIDAERRIRVALAKVTANEALYRRQAYLSDMNLADDAYHNDDPRRLNELLDRHIPGKDQQDLRGFEWHFLRRTCTAPGRTLDHINGKSFYYVRFSPDRSTLAASASDGTIRLFDTKSWRRTRVLQTGQREVNSLDYTRDGKWLVSAGDDGTARIWETENWTLVRAIRALEKEAYGAVFVIVGDELWVAVCGNDRVVRMFDANTGERRGKTLEHDRPVEAMAAMANGRLVTASEDGSPRIWDLATGELIRRGPAFGDELHSIAVSPDEKRLAFGTNVPQFMVWDWNGKAAPRLFPVNSERPGEGEAPQTLTFFNDGKSLLLCDRGGVVRVVSITAQGEPASEKLTGRHPRWIAHGDRIGSSVVTPDNTRVVTAGRDGRLMLWAPFLDIDGTGASSALDSGLFVDVGLVEGIATGPDDVVAVAGNEGIHLVHLERRTVRVVANDHVAYKSIERSSDGRTLIAEDNATIYAWRSTDDRFAPQWQRGFEGHPGISKIRLSADARFVAALISPDSTDPKEVHLLDATTGKTLAKQVVPGSFGVAFSPDGLSLAVGRESEVLILRVPEFVVMRRLQGHHLSIRGIAFSPQGRWLATGAGDRNVMLWDTKTWRPMSWVAHGGEVVSVTFSPDERTLLSVGIDNIPQLWDIASERPLVRLPQVEHPNSKPFRFTGDGERIVGIHPRRGLYVFDGRPVEDR